MLRLVQRVLKVEVAERIHGWRIRWLGNRRRQTVGASITEVASEGGGIFSTHGIGKPTRCTTSTTGESPAAPIMDQRRLSRPKPLSIRVGPNAAVVKGQAALKRHSAAPRDDANRSGRKGARHRHLGATANALALAGITARRRRGAGTGRSLGACYAVTGICGGCGSRKACRRSGRRSRPASTVPMSDGSGAVRRT